MPMKKSQIRGTDACFKLFRRLVALRSLQTIQKLSYLNLEVWRRRFWCLRNRFNLFLQHNNKHLRTQSKDTNKILLKNSKQNLTQTIFFLRETFEEEGEAGSTLCPPGEFDRCRKFSSSPPLLAEIQLSWDLFADAAQNTSKTKKKKKVKVSYWKNKNGSRKRKTKSIHIVANLNEPFSERSRRSSHPLSWTTEVSPAWSSGDGCDRRRTTM